MSQSALCLEMHADHIQVWEGGIWVCLLCAARKRQAQNAKTLQTQALMTDIVDHTRFGEKAPL